MQTIILIWITARTDWNKEVNSLIFILLVIILLEVDNITPKHCLITKLLVLIIKSSSYLSILRSFLGNVGLTTKSSPNLSWSTRIYPM